MIDLWWEEIMTDTEANKISMRFTVANALAGINQYIMTWQVSAFFCTSKYSLHLQISSPSHLSFEISFQREKRGETERGERLVDSRYMDLYICGSLHTELYILNSFTTSSWLSSFTHSPLPSLTHPCLLPSLHLPSSLPSLPHSPTLPSLTHSLPHTHSPLPYPPLFPSSLPLTSLAPSLHSPAPPSFPPSPSCPSLPSLALKRGV